MSGGRHGAVDGSRGGAMGEGRGEAVSGAGAVGGYREPKE